MQLSRKNFRKAKIFTITKIPTTFSMKRKSKKWSAQIDNICKFYHIELNKGYYLPYTKDFFGWIHNRYESHLYCNEAGILKNVLKGFSILQGCLAGKV